MPAKFSSGVCLCDDPLQFLAGDGEWRTPPGGGQAFAVGGVYISMVATNPATLLGYGTWVQIAAGRVLVGVDPGQVEFDTVRKTGGAKTHTIAESELPAHSHAVTDTGHVHLTQRYPTATGGSSGFTIDTSMSGTLADNTLPTKSATTGVSIQNTGGGQPMSLLQPSLTVYFWERTE